MLLLAAQIHPNALIGLGIAIGAGAAFNNRVFAIGQCASQFFVLGLLGAELFAHRGEFLLFGADGDLALEPREANAAQCFCVGSCGSASFRAGIKMPLCANHCTACPHKKVLCRHT